MEALANKAGLSLNAEKYNFVQIEELYSCKSSNIIEKALISRRMFQYYMKGKEPTKQVLISLAITLKLSLCEIESFLHKFGYCLSKSLTNDLVVLWFLGNADGNDNLLLYSINEVLDELGLPLVMTKPYDV